MKKRLVPLFPPSAASIHSPVLEFEKSDATVKVDCGTVTFAFELLNNALLVVIELAKDNTPFVALNPLPTCTTPRVVVVADAIDNAVPFIASGADYLISGDSDLADLRAQFAILTAREFRDQHLR